MAYSFDHIIERKQTNSTKWLKFSDPDVIPMWIADMDFTCPEEITEAMHERIQQGVFGYTDSYHNLTEPFVSKIKENSSAIELSTGIFEILSKMDKIPTDKAAEILKNEFQKGIL